MKDKINTKYTFNLAERKKLNVLKGGELDFDNMNKGYFDEIEDKDLTIKTLKKSLEKSKNWTIKHSVYSNMKLPDTWKNKLTYPQEVMKLISTDRAFYTYLSKVNPNNNENFSNDSIQNFQPLSKSIVDPLKVQSKELNISEPLSALTTKKIYKSRTKSQIFFSKNMSENIAKIEDSRRLNRYESLPSKKKVAIPKRTFKDKEVREILDQYRDLYQFTKSGVNFNNDNQSPMVNQEKVNNNELPNLTNNFQQNSFNSTQKSQMFKNTIYNHLMSPKIDNLSSQTATSFRSKSQNTKNKPVKVEYGPFLFNNYAEYNKKIEIKDPQVKKLLEDIQYFGPYFSHCPSCKNKNLEFYQSMDSHNCVNILNYLKKTRKNNKIKNEHEKVKE